jgi:hypothetical protein
MMFNSSLTTIQSPDSIVDPIVDPIVKKGQLLCLLLQMRNVAGKAEGAGFGVSSPAPDEDYRPAPETYQNLGCSDLWSCLTCANFKDGTCGRIIS